MSIKLAKVFFLVYTNHIVKNKRGHFKQVEKFVYEKLIVSKSVIM